MVTMMTEVVHFASHATIVALPALVVIQINVKPVFSQEHSKMTLVLAILVIMIQVLQIVKVIIILSHSKVCDLTCIKCDGPLNTNCIACDSTIFRTLFNN